MMIKYNKGDKFINVFNGCTGEIVTVDEFGYTFEFGITDFFVEKAGNFKINRQTVNEVQLKLLVEQGVLERVVKPPVEAVTVQYAPTTEIKLAKEVMDCSYHIAISTINKSGIPLYLKKTEVERGDNGKYTYEILGQSQFGDEMEKSRDPFKLLAQMFPLEDANTSYTDNYNLKINQEGLDALERIEFARKKMGRTD